MTHKKLKKKIHNFQSIPIIYNTYYVVLKKLGIIWYFVLTLVFYFVQMNSVVRDNYLKNENNYYCEMALNKNVNIKQHYLDIFQVNTAGYNIFLILLWL